MSTSQPANPVRGIIPPRAQFLGRERETRELLELLAKPDSTCLTLIGPGGVGKSRLAIQLATALANQPGEPFPDGIWFIPLAAIDDPAQVPATIRAAFGLEPTDESPSEAVLAFLREREALLILDNVEQVIEIAAFVAAIAAECRDVKILITSRRPLRIVGEQEYTLSPLPLPAPNDAAAPSLRANPAVALFLQRASMVNPTIVFDDRTVATVAEICRGLDGLPLAIELAASRVKALSPAVLANQLGNRLRMLVGGPRDAPVRQQTLRSTIAWSYDLLAPWEQQLFRQLAIFTNGFSLALVEAFIQGDEARDATSPQPPSPISYSLSPLDVIAALVDHSLIQSTGETLDDPRWRMLETVREFGLDQLTSLGWEPAYRRLHAETMAGIADRAEDGMYGAEQTRWIARIAADDGNYRAALTWAMANGEKTLALRIAGPLWRYWSVRHLGNEGRAFLTRALEMPGEVPLAVLGTAQRGAGCLFEDIGAPRQSELYHRQALETWQRVGDTRRIARSFDDLGNVAHEQGAFDLAESLHTQALELARQYGHNRVIASSLSNLGSTAYLRGDLETARARWQEVLDSGVIPDPISRAVVTNNLGVVHLQLGALDQARDHLTAALAIHRELGMPPNAADVLINLSDVASRQGNPAEAKTYFAQAAEIYHRLDDPKGLHNIYFSISQQETEAGNWPEALKALKAALRYADRANNLLGYADTIERIVAVAVETPRAEDAAVLWGAARAIRERIGAQELPEQGRVNEASEAHLRKALDPASYTRALAIGGALQPRQAANRALAFADELMGQPFTKKHPARPRPPSVPAPEGAFKLTKREIEVLRLLADGRTDREIAEALFISPRTAGTHVTNIFGKLNVDTRTAAVALAFRHALL